MAEKIKLEVVTPDGMAVNLDVDEMTAFGTEGEFGVLPGHCMMLSALKIGELSYKEGGTTSYVSVSGGYAEVGPEKVTVLAEAAEISSGIDVDRAKAALARAEDVLKGLSPDAKGYAETQLAAERAHARLVTSKR